MRWKPIGIVVAIVIATSVATVVVRDAIDGRAEGGYAPRLTIDSAVLGEERDYTVHLPESYSSETARRYPVVFVLDGQSQAGHTAESAALMARIGVMPEAIVVGVSSMGADARKRDYTPPGMLLDTDRQGGPTGQGDRFLAFLREELIPAVERGYRTGRPRLLAGWSRGGLFVVYSLIADPDLFDGRLAHSPALWRDDGRIVQQIDRFLESGDPAEGFLFLSLGENENDKMKGAFAQATAMLERRATPVGLCWFFETEIEPGAPTCRSAADLRRAAINTLERSALSRGLR